MGCARGWWKTQQNACKQKSNHKLKVKPTIIGKQKEGNTYRGWVQRWSSTIQIGGIDGRICYVN